MRILLTIAHYFNPEGGGKHGSLAKNPQPRILALSQCIAHLWSVFGRSQSSIDIAQCAALPVNQAQANDLDIVICTTGDRHLLGQLPLDRNIYRHHATHAEPMFLGFECQAVLRDSLGHYDYYCYLEDDLILRDPWFFIKLKWFTQHAGDACLLQPNRYEIAMQGQRYKAYIDGDLAPKVTARFQNVKEAPELKGKIMEESVLFKRTLNPHSGCYFLNARQMAYWAQQPYFLDRDPSFIGPLESAATLGIMRTFKIYKPARDHAGFLEIQHFGSAFLQLIGNTVRLD
jgi:hypothetical protein